MGFQLPQIVAELIQPIARNRKLKSGQDGLVDLFGRPPADRSATMQQYFHKPDHARVVDLDAGKPRGSHDDR